MGRLVMSVGVAAVGVLMAASSARAGETEGDMVVTGFEEATTQSLEDYDAAVDAIVANCIAKLAVLDERGADEARLETFAQQCQGKLLARGIKESFKVHKLGQKAVGRLGNLFEDELVAQVTAIVDAREAWALAAADLLEDAGDAIQTALEAEILD